MASPPLRGPPGGSRKNLLPEAKRREVGLFVYRDPPPDFYQLSNFFLWGQVVTCPHGIAMKLNAVGMTFLEQ
jgi:hypothetical protein